MQIHGVENKGMANQGKVLLETERQGIYETQR